MRIAQEYKHPNDRPFPQDWKVSSVSWCPLYGRYSICGTLPDGEPFLWLFSGMIQVFDWRFDFSEAEFGIRE